MEYKRLEQSLIDIVKEEQAKLGYRKEDVRLYYPLSTLNHFFDTEDTVEEMAERLTHLPEDMKARLGEIAVTHKKDRFCTIFRSREVSMCMSIPLKMNLSKN